jgi:hypothetical protein
VHAQNFIGAPLEKVWVYQFDASQNQGTLTQIHTSEKFKQRFKIPQEQYDNSAR